MTLQKTVLVAMAIHLIFSVANSAHALDVNQNLAFTTVNQNPWVPEATFEKEFKFDELRPRFGPLDPPTLHGNPVNALIDFLGIDEDYLPFDADASIGGDFSGSA